MIRMSQLKLDVSEPITNLLPIIEKKLHIKSSEFTYKIHKKSYDVRPKHPLKQVFSVQVFVKQKGFEEKFAKRNKDRDIQIVKEVVYEPIRGDKKKSMHPPVVVGAGPAGLFCAYILALNGLNPIVLERGKDVEQRKADVKAFWKEEAPLNPESNVQFGEGGAGTFSDGKLNTSVKDKYGRQTFILDTFVKFGAPPEIAYLAKPHIGTDYLIDVVKHMREEIIRLGGEVRFMSKLTGLVLQERSDVKTITELIVNQSEHILTNHVVLALGHSARDTFQMLYDTGVLMEQKPFAVGVRVEHPREQINALQYHEHVENPNLPTADYKLTYHAQNGRNVFTFCMCPGGYVVNASSESGGLVVNGMSNHNRLATNSNSAIVVGVTPEDYESDHPLAGVSFQRQMEQAAFEEGKGRIPLQLFGDFKENRASTQLGNVEPCEKGAYHLANVRRCLPDAVSSAIIEGVLFWNKKMPGYAREDALVLGVESRTSSPVKMIRDDKFQSNLKGVYPCGEGAGYAGGIMSAAIDGCKVAEAIIDEIASSEIDF